MSTIKRVNPLIGLKNIDVLVEDTSFDSTYFRVLECPSILTQGKSSFLIGGSQFLRSGVNIKFELVHDLTNEVIYTEAVFGHLEGDLRRVSIEIYDDVIPGPSTLYIVGELNPETSDVEIPSEWQNIYNVRWIKQITINAAGVNTQPIFFHKQPKLNVSEIFRGYLDVPTVATASVYLTGIGEPRQGLTPIAPTYNTDAQGNITTATFPDLSSTYNSYLSERSIILSLRNCDKPWDNITSRSISPTLKPPPIAFPDGGCLSFKRTLPFSLEFILSFNICFNR